MPLNRSSNIALPDRIGAPRYDIRTITPGIVHIGLGGFHRSHFARYTHDLMDIDPGARTWGIAGAGLRESDKALLSALECQDGLYILVERDAAGETRTLIGSIVRTIDASASTAALLATIARAETKIVSITVSEAGYHIDPATKRLALESAAIAHDIANPLSPRTMPGVLVAAFRQRRDAGRPAFTALSCDNIQHNGRILRDAVLTLAKQHDDGLAAWIAEHARFPSSMVDRITPVPTRAEIEAFAATSGITDAATVFSEAFRQWVIEDDFADGRPDWSRVGAQFVRDVTPYEAMKLRLLNASHLAIAGLGARSGYETVEQTMSDPAIRSYMRRLMDEEIEPLLAPVPGIDLDRYKASLIERFANPAIRDTVARINADAPINLLLGPIRDALAANAPIALLSLALAAWCRRVCNDVGRGKTISGANASAELEASAKANRANPANLLAVNSVFGETGRNERLNVQTRAWLKRIDAGALAAALRQI
jgi:mannitol 2-dehydrogenase